MFRGVKCHSVEPQALEDEINFCNAGALSCKGMEPLLVRNIVDRSQYFRDGHIVNAFDG
jgi:hypothetical protein